MPGIRIEGSGQPRAGSVPPGFAQEAQLAQAIGGDPYGGMTLNQLQGIQAGAAASGSWVQQQMATHAQSNQSAVRASMGAWNPLSRGAYADAGWGNQNYNMQWRQIRQEADYENRDRQLAQARMHRLDYEIRMEAVYENRDRDLAYRAMRRDADAENRAYRIDVRSGVGIPSFPGAPMGVPAFMRGAGAAGVAGGGGGGRGGGRGGGFGGDGGGGIPFAGYLGLGATSKALTGGLGLGLAGAAAEELFFLPQHLMGLETAALGHSMPWMNLRLGTAAMGRAGRFPGGELMSAFGVGGQVPPEWMRRLGLGPTEAFDLLQSFGISPTSGAQGQGIVQALGGMQFAPGLSGMSPGQLAGSAGAAARYGMISPSQGGIAAYTQQMSEVLSRAVEQGMDRAAILRSIDASVAIAARSGGFGMAPGTAAGFLGGFSNLPGGRTGEVGLSYLQSVNAAIGQVGEDPMRTIMFGSKIQGLKTESAVQQYFDRVQPGFYQQIVSNPSGRQLMTAYLQAAQQGDQGTAIQLMKDMLRGGGELISNDILTNNQMQPFGANTPQGVAWRARTLGVTSQAYISQRDAATESGMAGRVRSLGPRLMRELGITSEAAGVALSNFAFESSISGINEHGQPMGSGGVNLAQWTGSRRTQFRAWIAKNHPGGSEYDPELGLQFFEYDLKTNFPGLYQQMRTSHDTGTLGHQFFGQYEAGWDPRLMRQEGGHTFRASNYAQISRNAGRDRGGLDAQFSGGGGASGDENMPTEELGTISTARAGAVVGAAVSATELMKSMDLIIAGLDTFNNYIKRAEEELKHPRAPTAFDVQNSPF